MCIVSSVGGIPPSAFRVGLKRVRLRRCSFVTCCSGYASLAPIIQMLLKPTVCVPLMRRRTRVSTVEPEISSPAPSQLAAGTYTLASQCSCRIAD